MDKSKLTLYSIIKFNDNHIDEICDMIISDYNSGAITCPMFNMSLHAEGTPVVDKAEAYCKSYIKYKEKLDKAGIKSGVLIQSTIGHGYKLFQDHPFQKYTNLTDGAETSVACPSDKCFNEYIYNAVKKIALCKPSAIMIDDDFRLVARAGKGCACPHHIRRFNEVAGLNLTREELYEKVKKNDEEGKRLYDIFASVNHESMAETARVIRKAIDDVDPTIQGSLCTGAYNTTYDVNIAKILAGKDNPVIVRLNNGFYSMPGTRFYSFTSFRAYRQCAKLKKHCDIILAETDTCPHNRYSTSAHALHTHFTCSVLEGCTGAKQWLMRTPYEPQSGVAYKKILSKYAKFYQAVADLAPKLKWHGFATYSSLNPDISFAHEDHATWISYCLEVLGLPVFFNSDLSGVVTFDGPNVANYDNETILEILSKKVILSSDSAKALIDKGYGKYLGVNVQDWVGKTANQEIVYNDDEWCSMQKNHKELVITNEKTKVLSKVCNTVVGGKTEYLFPGSTKFENSLGGTVYVFCGTPFVPHTYHEGYSFLNYTRKRQLLDILIENNEAPIYYEGDEEVYLKVADIDGGGQFVSFINQCADPVENVTLTIDKNASSVYKLNENGEKVAVEFTQNGNKLTLNENAYVLQPLMLFIY